MSRTRKRNKFGSDHSNSASLSLSLSLKFGGSDSVSNCAGFLDDVGDRAGFFDGARGSDGDGFGASDGLRDYDFTGRRAFDRGFRRRRRGRFGGVSAGFDHCGVGGNDAEEQEEDYGETHFGFEIFDLRFPLTYEIAS